ncbi:MAG: TIGR04283 family arsenosugar biosynthesis glycosyltransferase, partial [Pseudomonadota bacterium]
MISVIIPTLNAASSLPRTLASLLDANQHGVIREVIISDGGSVDQTKEVAHHAGATLIEGPKGRGSQLARGAAAAKGEWLLFLHADTQLEKGWQDEAMAFCQASCRRRAAVFRLQFDEKGWRPFLVAMGANFRARFLRLPYGDQGLLISRAHYDHSGGFADMPLMEDV